MPLSTHEIELIASRTAELTARSRPEEALRHVSTATLAQLLELSEDWVRDHAAELGAIRAGGGQNGELRFEVARVQAALEARRLAGAPSLQAPKRARAQRRRRRSNVELLPIPSRSNGRKTSRP